MAENTVVKEPLTNEMIEAGDRITRKLGEMGVPLITAMWFFDSDINTWRLLFASPMLPAEGQQAVYKKIHDARKALGALAESVPFSSIGLIYPNNYLEQLSSVLSKADPAVSRVRFSKNVINGHVIDDALVYRTAA